MRLRKLSLMAKRRGRCEVNQPVSVKTVAGKGRNRGRTCIQMKVEPGHRTRKTKGGGLLQDSGKRFLGCFTNRAKLKAAVAKADNRKSIC